MDDPLLVSRLQRIGNLTRDWQRLFERNRSMRNPVGQGWSLDELQHERADAVRFLQAVDGGDVGVIESGQRFSFANEPGHAVRGGGGGWG